MTDKNFTRIIHNIQDYCFFKYLGGDIDPFNDLEKIDIECITQAIKKADKIYKNDSSWQQDKKYIINIINEWAILFRCPRLYIKTI